ncbi:hypothetical protein OS493_036925 [Desmophyllum pertusum]|uniref:Uncharacterized protein n=1 Tax=Desmophyllum pertusum TaxID=174260 RepID=A0A9X0D7K9_9CNID|nr:hypothetical protein OS493_036925 [Desmophyllum pertusum]
MFGLLICSLLILDLLSTGSSLTCQACYSQKSWADCSRNSRLYNCSDLDSSLDTCMTVHRKKTLQDGKIVHEFAKSCFVSSFCSKSFCEQKMRNAANVTCGVLNCCTHSLCNLERNPTEYNTKRTS